MNTIAERIAERAALVATVLMLVALGACSDSGSILGPDNQVQVSSVADEFHWQASSLADVTDTETYNWTITTPSASVSHANAALTGGTATVTITDADGMQVYTASLSDASNGSGGTTGSGTAGTWTVVVTLSGATTDHINFQLADVP